MRAETFAERLCEELNWRKRTMLSLRWLLWRERRRKRLMRRHTELHRRRR
jgi:hypothetical protein